MTYYRKQHNKKEKFEFLIMVLNPDKETLKNNIKQRTKQMIELGLVSEVETLMTDEKINDSKPMKSIGYKEIKEYLNNKISIEEAINKINSQTYKLAKRQITWIKKRKNIIWIDPPNAYNKIEEYLNNFKD